MNDSVRRAPKTKPYLLLAATLFLGGSSAAACAQASLPPAFEVAIVKPSDPKNQQPPSVNVEGDRFRATGMTLRELVKIAYDLNYGADEQVSGGPAWTGSARFDILATEEGSVSEKLQNMTSEQRGEALRHMLRTLLDERFQLRVHRESRELPIYDLVTAKEGSKMIPAIPHSTPDSGATSRPRSWIRNLGPGQLEGDNADIETLVTALSMQPEIGGRLVTDKTGLTGRYDFTLKWVPEAGATAEPSQTDSGPSLFTALREQLGLRLESAKAPVEMIVIDHVELPTAD